MIKATALLSNVKAVESFGYVSTESVGENIKKATSGIKDTIIKFIDKIVDFFKRIFGPIIAGFTELLRQKRMRKQEERLEKLANELKLEGVTSVRINSVLWKSWTSATSNTDKLVEAQNKIDEALKLVRKHEYHGSDIQKLASTLRNSNYDDSAIRTLMYQASSVKEPMRQTADAIVKNCTKVKTLIESNEIINGDDFYVNLADLIKKFNIVTGKIESMNQFITPLSKFRISTDTELRSIRRDINEFATAQNYLVKIGMNGSAATVYECLSMYSKCVAEVSNTTASFIRKCSNVEHDMQRLVDYIEKIAANIDNVNEKDLKGL